MIVENPFAKESRSVALALGGGGARGLAHFGVVQAINENGFEIERIVGVSIGSLVGAMSGLDKSPLHVQRRVFDYMRGEAFLNQMQSLFGSDPELAQIRSNLLRGDTLCESDPLSDRALGQVLRERSLLAGNVLAEVIAALVPDIDISELEIPLSIVAIDLRSGLPMVLEKGSLRRAIIASTSVPGFFPPVPWDDMLLCDIGVIDSLPTKFAHSNIGGMVIGVDVGPDARRDERCDTALHALFRMDEICEQLFRPTAKRAADLLIRPDVGNHPWHDFSQPQRLFAAGLRAARRAISEHRLLTG